MCYRDGMVTIERILARQILDSRGNPTVEAEVWLSDGAMGRASVPSGASTGTHEALELRDGDTHHFQGKGVLSAVRHIQEVIAPALRNNDPYDQLSCDSEVVMRDGTPNLSQLGANATLSVSLALSRAAASSRHWPYYKYIHLLYQQIVSRHQENIQLPQTEYPLPTPMFNILNGGAHTNWQSTSFQEFMVVPLSAPSFAEKLEQGVAIYHQLKALLKQRGFSTLLGDEGGFAPAVRSDQEAIELILTAIDKAGYQAGKEIGIALDPATSELYKDGQYHLTTSNQVLSTEQMIQFWQNWISQYPIVSLEDGLAEDDWAGWQHLSRTLGSRVMLVGDDHLVTNPERIERAKQLQTCNALLMKINQIGTLSESLQAVYLSRQAGWKVIVSHRSGETEDTSIADIAVGLSAEFVKMGALARSERVAKYNQLLRIESELS